MAVQSNQPGGGIETKQTAAVEKVESNLSETAQLVNGMLKEYIMPVLRDKGLVKEANEITKAKLPSDDPRVIEFALACREEQAAINERAEKEGCDEKKLAVISNYFSKLISSVQFAGQISAEPEAEAEDAPAAPAPTAVEAPQEVTA